MAIQSIVHIRGLDRPAFPGSIAMPTALCGVGTYSTLWSSSANPATCRECKRQVQLAIQASLYVRR